MRCEGRPTQARQNHYSPGCDLATQENSLPRNLITDVPGLRVGHADDPALGSGVTAVVFDEPAAASLDVRGGGPGTRETDLLDPAMTVERVDALAFSGGSAFGL